MFCSLRRKIWKAVWSLLTLLLLLLTIYLAASVMALYHQYQKADRSVQTNLQVVYEGDFIILCVQYCAVNLLQMPLRVCCGKTSSYKLVKKDFFV